MFKTLFAITFLLLPSFLLAKVWVYSYPENEVEPSPYYTVKIEQGDTAFDSYTCFFKATQGNLERSSSWTTFSFNNKISIEVEVTDERINEFIIRPVSSGIKGVLSGNNLRIELNEPQKLCVEINGNKTNPLFIFADKPEENVPPENGKGLWFFGPGVHKIGAVALPDSVKHIYIAGGAYVEGAFRNANRASNIQITGRGILCSPHEKTAEQNSSIIDFSGEGINSYVEGITILGESFGGIKLNQRYSTLRNCKVFSWNMGSGGIFCGPHALIEECFFRCNTDVINMWRDFLQVQKCIFWQNERGAPFQMSWNLHNDTHNFRIYNCDVIHCEHVKEANNAAIFSAVHAGAGNLSNYLFDDIRIEGDVFRLFKLTIRTNLFDKDTEYGTISNVQFRNITLEGQCISANEIWGYNQDHTLNRITFENVAIADKKIENANDGNFKINLNTASKIVFK